MSRPQKCSWTLLTPQEKEEEEEEEEEEEDEEEEEEEDDHWTTFLVNSWWGIGSMCSCFKYVCCPMRSNTMHIAAMR